MNVLDLNNDVQAVSICEDKVSSPFVTLAFDLPRVSEQEWNTLQLLWHVLEYLSDNQCLSLV